MFDRGFKAVRPVGLPGPYDPMEEDKDYYDGANNVSEEMVAFIKTHTKLPGLTDSHWQERHEEAVRAFLTSSSISRLFLFLHENELVTANHLGPNLGIHGSDVK